jgi:hypothetical protein
VVVAYTDDGGRWESVDLAKDEATGEWVGTIPTGAIALVQVVDEAGNVTIGDNGGRYYGTPDRCGWQEVFLPAVARLADR